MKTSPDYTVRTMTRDEVNIAIDWAAKEGWNPGIGDAECFFRTDPDGFLLGQLNGEPVAAISAITYGRSFGFLGFFIVREEFRGMGLGFHIWNAGLKRLDGRSIGLDGVVAQQDNYKKSGFTLAYRNIRFQGNSGRTKSNREGIRLLSELPFDDVNAYDRSFFPDKRKAFLQCWINQKNCTALGVMEHDQLAGYGVVRSCRYGYKIGPLFADKPDLAEKLFCALTSAVPEGSPVFLDLPETNHAALEMAGKYKMETVFETARMYKGKAPRLPLNRIFGVTSFELG